MFFIAIILIPALLWHGIPLAASPDEAVLPDAPYCENPPGQNAPAGAGDTGAFYTVQAGDCLLAIADRFNINPDTLCASNRIGDRNLLHPGQELIIPGAVAHAVAPGENLNSIARQYGVSAQELAAANNIAVPDLITPGQLILIPPDGQNPTPPPDETNEALVWPLPGYGDITSPFGWREIFGRNEFHQGVDIGCPTGTTVVSASAGRVIRVGWENPANERQGYGYYLVVRDNDKLYYYGHLTPDSNLVRVGDEVQPGQALAKSGDSGDATGPHLHFGIESVKAGANGVSWLNPLAVVKPQNYWNAVCALQSDTPRQP